MQCLGISYTQPFAKHQGYTKGWWWGREPGGWGGGGGLILSHSCLKETATTALFGVLNQSARHLRTLSPTSSSWDDLKGEFLYYSKHTVTISVAIQNTL